MDKSFDEYKRWFDSEVERIIGKGQVQLAELYKKSSYSQEQFEQARSYIQRWGINREEAARNYMAHIQGPCNWCIDIYTDILVRDATADLRLDKNRDSAKSVEEALLEYAHEVHLEYLGNPKLEKLTQIKFGDEFFHLN